MKWYYVYLVDDIPQQLPADNCNGYTGPFDTEREAWLSLYTEMFNHIEELKNTQQVAFNSFESPSVFPLPIAAE